jgi:ribosomal protein S18 acetylase RimI-like enzyme
MKMRKAKIGDKVKVIELVKQFSNENPSSSDSAKVDLNNSLTYFDKIIDNSFVYVGEIDNNIVAVISFTPIASLVHGGKKILFVDLLVVEANHRRNGLGSFLVRFAQTFAQNINAYKILLTIRENNFIAHKMYSNCGFGQKGNALVFYL